jgi:UDP-N-acetylmuramate-alanine ligase
LHLHIIGICGTFMGGIAALACAAGHRVTGSDRNVYPPMSTQLAAMGVDVIEGYEPDQLALKPDVFVVGNVMVLRNALIEGCSTAAHATNRVLNGLRTMRCRPLVLASPVRTQDDDDERRRSSLLERHPAFVEEFRSISR